MDEVEIATLPPKETTPVNFLDVNHPFQNSTLSPNTTDQHLETKNHQEKEEFTEGILWEDLLKKVDTLYITEKEGEKTKVNVKSRKEMVQKLKDVLESDPEIQPTFYLPR